MNDITKMADFEGAEHFEYLDRTYANPKALMAALKAASYETLSTRQASDPSAEAARLCPRSTHYRQMAKIWWRAASLFEASRIGPSESKPWIGQSDED